MHDRFAGALAPDAFYPINGLFRVCASKAHTYAHYNAYLADNPSALLWKPVTHWVADTLDALGVSVSELAELCAHATRFVAHVITHDTIPAAARR